MSSVHSDKDQDCHSTNTQQSSACRPRRSDAEQEKPVKEPHRHRSYQGTRRQTLLSRESRDAPQDSMIDEFKDVSLDHVKSRTASFTESERSLIRGVLHGRNGAASVDPQQPTQSTVAIDASIEKMSIPTLETRPEGTAQDDDWVDVEKDLDDTLSTNHEDNNIALYDDLSALMEGTSKIVEGSVIIAGRLWRLAGRGIDRFVDQKP